MNKKHVPSRVEDAIMELLHRSPIPVTVRSMTEALASRFTRTSITTDLSRMYKRGVITRITVDTRMGARYAYKLTTFGSNLYKAWALFKEAIGEGS